MLTKQTVHQRKRRLGSEKSKTGCLTCRLVLLVLLNSRTVAESSPSTESGTSSAMNRNPIVENASAQAGNAKARLLESIVLYTTSRPSSFAAMKAHWLSDYRQETSTEERDVLSASSCRKLSQYSRARWTRNSGPNSSLSSVNRSL